MKDIESFTVDHVDLEPGIYVSRRDKLGDREIITYDIRMTSPNDQQPLEMNGVHTLEHTGATYLRNHEKYGDEVIYFGPMGCRTGYYLILTDALNHDEVYNLVKDMFEFLVNYNGDIPGATEHGCGNWTDHSQHWCQFHSREFLEVLEEMEDTSFEYPKFN